MLLPLKTEEFLDPAKILIFFHNSIQAGTNPLQLSVAHKSRNLRNKRFKYAFMDCYL